MLCCLSAFVFPLMPNESLLGGGGLKMALSFKTKRHHKPCGTQAAVIIKLSSELRSVMPACAGTRVLMQYPLPTIKKPHLRRPVSSKLLTSSFQHDSSASSGPWRAWERLLMVVGLKESLEGPSCQSCPLPAASIYHIPRSFSPVDPRLADALGGWGSSQLHPAGEASNKAGSTKASFSTRGQKDAEQWRDDSW